MGSKDLKEKAIKIQGKEYVQVADRIIYFNEAYTNGSITTELISPIESDRIVVKALVTPDCDHAQRVFTGYSQAVIGQGMVNKTAALENAETSAVGRALAMMGIGVLDSVASADEIQKATHTPASAKATTTSGLKCEICEKPATERRGTNKAGKPYHAIFCSSQDGTHTKWLPVQADAGIPERQYDEPDF